MPMQDFFRINTKAALCLALFLAAMQATPARSADVIQVQTLNFGKWVVTDNDAPHFITIATDGSYDNSPELIMLEPPQEGIYDLSGLPEDAIINGVTVIVSDPLDAGSSMFALDDFQVIYPPTAPGGEISVTIGARASTTGDGQNYGDGVYNGTLTIEIHL